MGKNQEEIKGTEKDFLDIFRTLCYSRSAWQVWADVISAMACSLSNAVDRTPGRYEKREKEYEQCIKRLGSVETVAKLFAVVTMALENNPDQDFLGKMYMGLELSNHWRGQFFTPYNICRMMAEMMISQEKAQAEVQKQGYIAVNDPACGAGATLIAAANSFRRCGVNYQSQVMFVANDIDRIVAQMCYIQLSLLGCPGYVAVANTLSNPVVGDVLEPHEKEGQEFWYTPFFFGAVWQQRRAMEKLKRLFAASIPEPEPIKMRGGFLFEFEKGAAENVV